MVLRLKHAVRKNAILLTAAILFSVLFLFPYWTSSFLAIEHDTFFHLSRIEGLAQSIAHGELLPTVYPLKNNGFGYASALFYCDLLLYPAALLYLAGVSIAACYKFQIALFTFFSAFFHLKLLKRMTGSVPAALLGTAAYLFSNYRITDVYVRGAVGEISAMVFLPLLMLGLYDLLEKDNGSWIVYCIGLIGLVFSHNLSFLLAVILVVVFVACYSHRWSKQMWKGLAVGTFFAFIITAFFTLPMLEQTTSQQMYLHYYGSSSSLESYSMPLWKYIANKTVFGYGNRDYSSELSMLVNIGWFLTFSPIVYCIFLRKKKSPLFVRLCLAFGYVCLILPYEAIPWQRLSAFRILQFPWRLNQMSMLLLSIFVAWASSKLRYKGRKLGKIVCVLLLCSEGVYHLYPATKRTFGITSKNLYSDITDGVICDPYYSATYMRVELAGGDYVPMNAPDYRYYSTLIKDNTGNDLEIPINRDYRTTFTVDETFVGKTIEIPITWYKGYSVIAPSGTKIEVVPSPHAMIEITITEAGTYTCLYTGTTLLHASRYISLIGILFLIIVLKTKQLQGKR